MKVEGDPGSATNIANLTGVPDLIVPAGFIDGRTDLYSLACIAYWALTGRAVVQASTPAQMLLQHVQTPPAPLSTISELPVPDELEAVLIDVSQERSGEAILFSARARVAAGARPGPGGLDAGESTGLVGGTRAGRCRPQSPMTGRDTGHDTAMRYLAPVVMGAIAMV